MDTRPEWADTILGELAGLRAGQDSLRAEVGELRAEVGPLRGLPAEVAQLRRSLDGLRGLPAEVAELRRDLDGLRGLPIEFDRLRGEVVELRGEVAALGTQTHAEIERLQARMDVEFPKLRTDLMARMDRLQEQLGGHYRDIGVNFASSDRAVRAARAQREEMVGLEEQVSALTKLVYHLQGQIQALRGDG